MNEIIHENETNTNEVHPKATKAEMPPLFWDVFTSENSKTKKIDTMDFLFENLSVDLEKVKNSELFLRNYLYTTILVRKHLSEINCRIKEINAKMKTAKDYDHKKLLHFRTINSTAKDEIIDFISNNFVEFVTVITNKNVNLINKNGDGGLWVYYPMYDYYYHNEYYNPNYDFSTATKFYHSPRVRFIDFIPNINKHIQLKKQSVDEYYNKVFLDVDSMIDFIKYQVKINYHFSNRSEIFDSMFDLFCNKKYLAFITISAIQIEGMFYELLLLKKGKKESFGTLKEKAQTAFQDNKMQDFILYPHFAFDVPKLRNEIAHTGITNNCNIKQTAYELVLDLNCILTLAGNESTEKFNDFLKIFVIFIKIKKADFENDEKYFYAVSLMLIQYLHKNFLFIPNSFWGVLSNPLNYADELSHYDSCDKELCTSGIVTKISNIAKNSIFWGIIIDIAHEEIVGNVNPNKEAIRILQKLKNTFIGILDGESKNKCIQLSAILSKVQQ
ncbi:MAG: hypothetical protein FWE05_11635 [Defluviitaleaceae bacterium]|nr:hypothetical protein [Defluviitaleaceae bacterium]